MSSLYGQLAQFQFQFVYLPFFSHKCKAENVESEKRKQRKMGKGRLVFPSLDVSGQEKAQKLGLLSLRYRGTVQGESLAR